MNDVVNEYASTAVSDGVELPPPEQRGRLDIADRVIETITRKAAASVSETRHATGLGRITSTDLPHVRVAVSAGHVAATLVVAAGWPSSVSAVAHRVQNAVTRHVHDYTGLTVSRVDVDVHCVSRNDHPTSRRVQ